MTVKIETQTKEKPKIKKFSKLEMRKVYMEAIERYDRIAKDLPPSFNRDRRLDENGEEEVELKTGPKNGKKPFPRLGNAPRAKTIMELHKRLNEMKGKTGYQATLIKKGLKNRLTKKQKLEERKEKKMKAKAAKKKGNTFKPTPMDEVEAPKPSTSQGPSLMFNKFDFEESESKPVTKDPKAALLQIEKSEKKLKSLEQRGHADKVMKIKTQKVWDKAIRQAEGVKVKDDVELLKKSIAKKKQKKAKSAQKWDTRLEMSEKKKLEKQKKRKENISAKNKQKKDKKIKKSIKKGRVVL